MTLLPCPFCGGTPVYYDGEGHADANHIECQGCGCKFDGDGQRMEDRVKLQNDWNTRYPSSEGTYMVPFKLET